MPKCQECSATASNCSAVAVSSGSEPRQKENHHTGRLREQNIYVSCQSATSRCCSNYYSGEGGSKWRKYEEQLRKQDGQPGAELFL